MDPATTTPVAPPPMFAGIAADVSVGSVIGRTFSTWSANLVPFSIFVSIVHLPTFALSVWQQYQRYGGYPTFEQILQRARVGGAAAGDSAALTSAIWVLLAVCTFVEIAALTSGAIQHLAGKRSSVGALLRAGIVRAWPVFLVGILVAIICFLGTLLLVIPGMIAFCALSVAIPAVVAEAKGPIAALRRSLALTRGRRFTIWLAFLVMGLIAWTASALGGLLPLFAGGGTASLVGAGMSWLVGAVVGPLWTLLPPVLYHDLRVAREGVDTAELARVFE